ncbi:MAG TPA: RNA polymerase sigma factor [Candidatus Limnocylindrales bacterium]|jgi:RNA polymerase sigma-70 factor (ECF subfamily)
MDVDLVDRAKAGDRGAFAELAASRIDGLFRIARLILRDQQLAEDAVQEALIRCWRQLPKLRDNGSFDGWLNRILYRAAVDESNRRRRFVTTLQNLYSEPSVADNSQVIVEREALERAFVRLSIEQRAVVVLHHYADMPLGQVATTLGIPLGTVKSRHHYALATLKTALERDGLALAEGLQP